ncbi:MAG: peptidoglycan DD-metalloendopeptidase family protein [Actinomycetia bacterium]|nr:peptidoglycan DD-metalloendopeptidase family protein [Actinomycetes bacterium]
MRVRAALAAGVAMAALLAGLLAPASADDLTDKADQLDERIAETESALEGASQRLQRAAADLVAARAQLPGARAAYSAAAGRLTSARERLALIRQQLRELRAQQEKVQAEIAAAQRRITRSETLIARIVRYQYQTGGYAELQVVLDADSPTDFVQRVMATQSVTESQSEIIDRLNADKSVLAAREQQMQVTEEAIAATEAEAEKQVDELASLADEAREAKRAVKNLIGQRADALSIAEEERAAEEQRLADLEAAQVALAAEIAQSASTGTATGRLIWPLPGFSAGGGVGWRTHPVYGYRSCHTGIDISASSGTEIIAARAGTVIRVEADNGGPYGNNTLIDHGNGLATFYAHQSGFAVAQGDRVAKGEVIGYVGSTGYSTGSHLHFEVHINGVPHDPMGWFGGVKTPQSEFCP